MTDLRHHPFLPKLISPEDEIRYLRKLARYAKKSDNLKQPITIPMGFLVYFDEAADALEEQLPKEDKPGQEPDRPGMYL